MTSRLVIVDLLFPLSKLDFVMSPIWGIPPMISPIRAVNSSFEGTRYLRATSKTHKKPPMHLMEIGSVQGMSVKSIRPEESTSSIV